MLILFLAFSKCTCSNFIGFEVVLFVKLNLENRGISMQSIGKLRENYLGLYP